MNSQGHLVFGFLKFVPRGGYHEVLISALWGITCHSVRENTQHGAIRLECWPMYFASWARRSASDFSGPSNMRRISAIPGEKKDQYSRNFARALASVVATRVSVRKTDSAEPIGSARNVHTIFTYPGS